jgi:hypothetical protein
MSGWIGVDLDGTLAEYDGWKGVGHIGQPVPLMLERVLDWVSKGVEVRIFTARIFREVGQQEPDEEASLTRAVIEDWCLRHVGRVLPITCTKDYGMVQLWDDRAIQVEENTDVRVDGLI